MLCSLQSCRWAGAQVFWGNQASRQHESPAETLHQHRQAGRCHLQRTPAIKAAPARASSTFQATPLSLRREGSRDEAPQGFGHGALVAKGMDPSGTQHRWRSLGLCVCVWGGGRRRNCWQSISWHSGARRGVAGQPQCWLTRASGSAGPGGRAEGHGRPLGPTGLVRLLEMQLLLPKQRGLYAAIKCHSPYFGEILFHQKTEICQTLCTQIVGFWWNIPLGKQKRYLINREHVGFGLQLVLSSPGLLAFSVSSSPSPGARCWPY